MPFMNLHLSFKRTAAATATLGNYFTPIFGLDFIDGTATLNRKEYISGHLSAISSHIFSIENTSKSSRPTFCSNDRFFELVNEQLSSTMSFKMNLAISFFRVFVLQAAEAISFQVPRNNALPRGSNSGERKRCLF